MACTLVQIPKKTCDKRLTPGIKRLFAILLDDVKSMPEVNKEIAAFIFNTGKNFFEIPFTDFTGQFTENYNGETIDSDNFNSNFTCFVPDLSPALSQALDSFVGQRLVLVGVLGTEDAPVQGDTLNPVRMTLAEGGSGADEDGERIGYTLTFTKQRGNGFTPFYTGAIDDLLVAGT